MPYFFWQHSFTSVTVSAETCDERNERRRWYCRLTIVGGGRDAPLVWRRGRLGTVCARGAHPTWSCGPSTSPLGGSLVSSWTSWRRIANRREWFDDALDWDGPACYELGLGGPRGGVRHTRLRR